MEMTLIGQTIRGYEIEKQIGKGGFGIVYQARQDAVDRTVAIKVILPQYANEPDFQQRFDAEARLVAKLEHPHIIPLYDYWQDETGAYLVLRYVPGGTLGGLLKQKEALSWSQARRILLQVIEALEVAHDHGVIHRDIKPDNILLDERGNAYLTDFGVAWMLGNVTEENMVTGTIAYIAPELLRSGSPSPQSDMYAMGILLYQMLTGVHPFLGTFPEMVNRQLTMPMPSILNLMPDLPPLVDTVILRLTMKDPEVRYHDVKSLLDAIENIDTSQAQAPKTTVSMLAQQQGLQQLMRGHGTLELRNRFSMIDTVYKYWIEGVLENLLAGYALLDLDLHLQPEYVSVESGGLNQIDVDQTQFIADNADSILNLFQAYNGKLLILGEAGTGKSTLLLALARDLLQQANQDSDFPIPVVLNLSSWSQNMPLGDWIVQELNEKYQVPLSIGQRWVQNDSLLLLLDGLDEVNESYREGCLDAINIWREEHSFVDVVVSCRTTDYKALPEQLQLNGAVVIQPLIDEQVNSYLDSVGTDTSTLRSILDQNSEMRELSHSPLMLGVMVNAYKDVTVEQLPDFQSVAEQRDYLFELYVQRTWDRRLADKQFSLADIKNWFSRLASGMNDRSESLFFVEDLQPTWLTSHAQQLFHNSYRIVMMLILSLSWLIASLLFNEPTEHLYYAALGALWGASLFFLGERFGIPKTMILFAVATTILRLVLDGDESLANYFQKSVFRSTLPYTLILGILIGLYHRTGQVSQHINSVDSLYFSFISTRWIGAVAGIAGGLLVTVPNILLGNEVNPLEVILKIAGTGMLAWLITGFRSNQIQLSANINEKIHRSYRNGLKMGLVGGLVASAMIAIAFHPRGFEISNGAPALFNFLPFAITTYLIYGGAVAIQHYLLRRLLVKEQIIPKQFINLLQEGVNLGIMRRVGGGFIFVHRYLLEYFANLQTEHKKPTEANP